MHTIPICFSKFQNYKNFLLPFPISLLFLAFPAPRRNQTEKKKKKKTPIRSAPTYRLPVPFLLEASMNVERLVPGGAGGGGGRFRYERMPARGPADDGEGEEEEEEAAVPERRPEVLAASASFRLSEAARVFEELPRASIVAVSRPDAGDITPMLLSYTIEVHYKQVRGSSPAFSPVRFIHGSEKHHVKIWCDERG